MNTLSNSRVSFDENLTVAEIDAELAENGLVQVGYPENVDGEVIYSVQYLNKYGELSDNFDSSMFFLPMTEVEKAENRAKIAAYLSR